MSNTEKETEFRNYISSLDEKGKANAYVKIKSIPSEEYISDLVSQGMSGMTREDIENVMVQALTVQMGMSEADVRAYTASMSDEEMDIDDAIADCILPQFRGSLPLGGRLSVIPL